MGSVKDYIANQQQMEKTAGEGMNPLAILLPIIALAGGAYAFRDKLGLGGDGGDSISSVLGDSKLMRGDGKPRARRGMPGKKDSPFGQKPPAGGGKGLANMLSGAFDKPENSRTGIKGVLGQAQGPKGMAMEDIQELARSLGLDI